MLPRGFLVNCLLALLVAGLWFVLPSAAVRAADIDPYVLRYLRVKEPVELSLDGQARAKSFSAEDLSRGKRLFEQNCINCHVGGATLPDPTVSLSLSDLAGATPPRDTIDSLVAYMRSPMVYDGSEPTFWCREVPESWLQQQEVEKLAAFVLRAAQTAPGWGTEKFDQ